MIKVFADRPTETVRNFWNAIHFHPTDAIEDAWGQRILNAVADDGVAETVRMYAMLEDIVSMDENGTLHYDFTENDVRMDYMLQKGFRLFVSYNFIPPCIASNPAHTSSVNKAKTRYKGKVITISPPKDYALWEEICRKYTEHIVTRYGEETVASWYLQCYNEPDIPSFFMPELGKEDADRIRREEEYLKLYTAFCRGVRAVSGKVRIGGPSCASNLLFMDRFFGDAVRLGLPLDFIGLHIYGTSVGLINRGERLFSEENNVARMKGYLEVISRHFPQGKPLIVDEWGASSHGFYNREECPPLMMRERSDFAAFFGKLVARFVQEKFPMETMMICLSGQHEMTENFSGFRNFFTLDFLKKPIYNAFILMRKLRGQWLAAEHTAENAEVLAAADDAGEVVAVAYASEHYDRALADLRETVTISGVYGKRTVRVWCIDETHTNPYALAEREGYKEPFAKKQLEKLRAEGELVPVAEFETQVNGTLEIPLTVAGRGLWLAEAIK